MFDREKIENRNEDEEITRIKMSVGKRVKDHSFCRAFVDAVSALRL
jgi:hypothetical protein